jgi:solute:Na+ symporter, SSS family
MEYSLHPVDYLIVILTLVLSIGVGLRFAKRQSSSNHYFSAGGSLPSWAVGMSILATLISSITFLAYPGEGFGGNWIRLVQGLMVPVVLVFLVGFVVPLFREAIGISAYEYFEKRFGYIARLYTSLAFILAHFSKMGTVFYLIALALARMMGIDPYVIIWIMGVSIIFLTLKGGLEAVVWLDVIQAFMLIGGGLIVAFILVFTFPGGPGALFSTASAANKFNMGPFDWNFGELTFIVMALNGVFYAIQKYGTDQTIIQRYLASGSNKEAVKSALMGVLLSVPVWGLFMFIGTALWAYYGASPAIPLPEGIKPDEVFPFFIMTKLPVGIAGLILAALMAAAISSLDSDMNCLSAIGVEDYYVRLKPESDDAQRLRMGKILVGVSGVAAIGVASLYVAMAGKGVLGIVFTLYAIFSGGIAGMFLLGVFSKRANKKGVYIGMAVTVLFTAWAVLTSATIGTDKHLILDLGGANFTHHKYMLGVYSHIVLIVVGYVASLFFPNEEPGENLTYWDWRKRKLAGDLDN